MTEQNPSRYQQAFNSYARLLRGSAGFMLAAGRTALRPVRWGMEAPGLMRGGAPAWLVAELPRSEAQVALQTILQGRAAQDEILHQTGNSMLAKAVVAAQGEGVPPEITCEVLQIAHDVGLVPETTLLRPEVAAQVRQAMDGFAPRGFTRG